MNSRDTRNRADDYRPHGHEWHPHGHEWHEDGTPRLIVGPDPILPGETGRASANKQAQIPNDQSDLARILVDVLQRVSTEVAPDCLVRSLMQTAVRYAGAERGFLIMYEGKTPRIVSEATWRSDHVEVHLSNEGPSRVDLPDNVAEFMKSHLQEDAVQDHPLSSDDFACAWQNHSGSALGLPLITGGKLIALLYLEKRRTPTAFTYERLAVLRLLASQAAISLENMRLAQELQEREAEVRRLMDADIIGIAIWTHDGYIVEANDAFVQIIGYTRGDIASGRIRWADLNPPEWREQDEGVVVELMAKGSVKPYEREYQRKDGSRVAVLIGCASLEGSGKRLAFVLDLTERKRADAMLRKLRTELDHAMRVMTMGALGASIAHETNQPLTAIATNASALMRWLETTPPNVTRARETAEWIMRDTEWAVDVTHGLKMLSTKATGHKEPVDLNKSIEGIIPLVHGDILHCAITLKTETAVHIPPVLGNRVQLQQVILNLIKNSIDAMTVVRDRPRELLIATRSVDGESVGVLIRDTGNAVTAEQLEYIFDTFYTTKSEGIGIGLSICKSIIQNHGGRLWAEINQDFGMTFEFTIPSYKYCLGTSLEG